MPRLDYFAPGVYVEEVDRGSRPIEGVPTNVGGFVGFTEAIRGGAELGKPMLVTSWEQYCEYFAREGSDGFTDFNAYLPFAVNGWFLNGGGRCWVISIGTRLPGTPARVEKTGALILTPGRRPSLLFELNPGEDRVVEVLNKDNKPDPFDEDEDLEGFNGSFSESDELFRLTIRRRNEYDEYDTLATYWNLSMNPRRTSVDAEEDPAETTEERPVGTTEGTYIAYALRESEYIRVIDQFLENSSSTRPLPLPVSRRPANGRYEVRPIIEESAPEEFGGDILGSQAERRGIKGSFEIDEINMLAFPDLMRAYEYKPNGTTPLLGLDQIHGVMERMISLCETANPNPPNRMVVLDPPPDYKKPQEIANWLNLEFGRRSMYAALYYPWIKVPNPRKQGKPILVPPCGHMMGVWSRTDETRGVYKAPANETPRGVIGLAYDCNFREQELLNPMGINCIRKFPNRGIKIWGARTLAEKEKTDWRYINVRRLISYIERSIEEGTQWVVFEPNDQDLWARVSRTVSNFLERIWREGALFGATPEEAFYVKCDEELNTPETMILGRLYVEVGVSPVRPAEFVIFRISQWTGPGE